MPEQLERREIEIDWDGPVAGDLAAAVKETSDGECPLLQELSGDIEGMEATVEVTPPYEILTEAKDALLAAEDAGEREFADVPDDPDLFGVVEVDVAVEASSTVTIEVYPI